MNRNMIRRALIALCLLAVVDLVPLTAAADAQIQRVAVYPGRLSARVVFETDASLSLQKAYYARELPRTIVLDLGAVQALQIPAIPAEEAALIKSVQWEKTDDGQVRCLIALSERVPFRIVGGPRSTVLELFKIQRGLDDYWIDPVLQQALRERRGGRVALDRVDIAESDERVLVRARLNGSAPAQVFALDNPPRLVVDLFETQYGRSGDIYPVNRNGLERVRVGQFQKGQPHFVARLVCDLSEPGRFDFQNGERELTLAFLKNPAVPLMTGAAISPRPAAEITPNGASPGPVAPPPAAVERSQPAPVFEPGPASASVPTEPRLSLPAPTPAVQETVKPDPQAAQEERFRPRTIMAQEEKYSGDVVSMKFKDADLRDIVLYLGEIANLNVIFDPEVRGIVTCDLNSIPWDQALDLILRNNKMGKTIEGNVLRIAPVNVLTREEDEQRQIRDSKELAGPLVVKTIRLSYSQAKDIIRLLQAKKSRRGEIITDDRTNTLIISDVREKVDLIERLIAVLDTPTPQVSIEARIVEASATFVRNLGIQWGYKAIADPFYGNPTTLQFPYKALADGALIPSGTVTRGIGGPLGGYAVNLPAPSFNTALGFSLANVLDTFRLDLALSALETAGQGKIISCPKVTAQNNQEAEIVQGRQIPVQTVANFTVTTRYINAALELKATPQITAEGTIIMILDIKNNAADFANLVNGIPPITTQSAKTTVMVPDGGTTVIGGIYRMEDSSTRNDVPFLNRIPILGTLFKSLARTKQNRELLIFITPRIMK
ncbi:MAG: type IV pilus secretin PilQ [Candidatus Aminicenantes bacterium]|nr:type IV pilus secretin PilQ [Candidatus Aminicenantes bacterium]